MFEGPMDMDSLDSNISVWPIASEKYFAVSGSAIDSINLDAQPLIID